MSEFDLGMVLMMTTLVVLATGVPIAFGFTAVSVAFLYFSQGAGSLASVATTFFNGIKSFDLLTIPLFIFFGTAIGSSAAGSDIYEAFHRWLARVPGGLVIANIFTCGLFAALCGSSTATAAAVGRVGIPEMRRRGVGARLASGAIAAGGTLGILIPPSITLIVYGIATEQSIGRLFLAGVVPGLMLVLIFSAYASAASRSAHPKGDGVRTYSLREKMQPLPRVLPFIGMVLFVLYALYGGIATPSEIAAVVALLAFLLVLFLYRRWSLRAWMDTLLETVRESCMILMIVAAAALFSYMMSLLYIPQSLAGWVAALDMNRWMLMGAINLAMLVAGCFLPPVAIILMMMPILEPILTLNHFDLIWFGIIMTINMEIGLITPPVGLNLYVITGVAPDVRLGTILAGVVPFILLMLLGIALLCLFPAMVSWLPDKLMGAAIL